MSEDTVVFIEDSMHVQKVYQRFCENEGINGVFYEQPPALEILMQYRTIITDLEMPGKTGLEVVNELRGGGWNGRIALVSSLAEEVHHFGGFNAYLNKPFTFDQLRGVLEQLLEITPTEIELR
ncbi:response regulator [Candidatus Woesearchaeota archaeon]|nr:response regulator [Candidatus Woesearchaeota archaeon]